MTSDAKLTDRIRQALAHLPLVEEKKMFGSIAFMVNGKMCIAAGKGRIMCRIDPALHDNVTMQKGVKTVNMRGRDLKGYVHVSEDTLKTKKELNYWIELALDYNKTAKASKKGSSEITTCS